MKYKEFKAEFENWGEKYGYETEVEIKCTYVYVKTKFGMLFKRVARIRTDSTWALDTDWSSFTDIKEDARVELLSIILKLAKTPPKDREDEKLFYLKNTSFFTHDYDGYLNFDNCEFYMLNSRDETKGHKTKFTLEEIEEIKKKFNTTLEDFELIEVEQ